MSYGGIIVSLLVPDRSGVLDDIVLGFDSLAEYVTGSHYLGAIVGRCANRISHGRFALDGTTHQLAINNGSHHLHGGIRGFDRVVWAAEPFQVHGAEGLALRHRSPDGDQGYPGTLTAEVRYLLTDNDELIVEYDATTDAPTPVNLTQHTYFNLAGGGDILGHELTIAADAYTPVDHELIPTGALLPVASTPFDFRAPTAIGARIGAEDPQLEYGRGYDHNWALPQSPDGPVWAARVVEPVSGRTLEVHTTEPGLQMYSGNYLDGRRGKRGREYGPRAGFTLETQHYPDSPNRPTFPSVILRPGERYLSRTVFAFGVRN